MQLHVYRANAHTPDDVTDRFSLKFILWNWLGIPIMWNWMLLDAGGSYAPAHIHESSRLEHTRKRKGKGEERKRKRGKERTINI